ncbi:MAG: hypothetical protein LH469_05665, partial [Frankiaceae bacterium]|nr:hypothetical protein [Frankiaceae bacterium]
MIHTEELTPISAVTSPDPYPYYRSLVAHRPLFRDEQAGMWVASSAAAVTAVLSSSALGVRPPDEPVPAGIVGTPAGEVFGRLVRMTDGDRHATAKPIVSAALSGVDAAVATEIATRRTAQVLDGDRSLARLLFKVPAGVVGELCGIALDVDVVDAVRRFVGCIPASATLADLAAASVATESLSDLLRPLLHASQPVLPAGRRRAAPAGGGGAPPGLVGAARGGRSPPAAAPAGGRGA